MLLSPGADAVGRVARVPLALPAADDGGRLQPLVGRAARLYHRLRAAQESRGNCLWSV